MIGKPLARWINPGLFIPNYILPAVVKTCMQSGQIQYDYALTHSKPYPDQTVASTKIVPWLFARVEYGVDRDPSLVRSRFRAFLAHELSIYRFFHSGEVVS